MKLERIFGVAACVVVALGLVLAFLVIGPPSHARLVALDRQRVRDLGEITTVLRDRFGHGPGALPKRLPNDIQERDPLTHGEYEFRKIDAKNYALCARFALAAESQDVEQSSPGQSWPHGAGRTCYEFDVSASEIAPRRIPAVSSRTK